MLMNKLNELGFELAADVILRSPEINQDISININKYAAAKNILYAVIFHSYEQEDDVPLMSEVVYIGHTRKTFRNRMNGYQSGCGTAVNNRVNREMSAFLLKGGTVVIMVLPDRHGMQLHGIDLDIAAGLEYSLIDYYCRYNRDNDHRVLFNIAGNSCIKKAGIVTQAVGSNLALQEAQEEDADYSDLETDSVHTQGTRKISPSGDCRSLPCMFDFVLTPKVYWPLPVFNVPVHCQHHFGPHGDVLRVDLPGNEPESIDVFVNRTANPNETPRIYFSGQNGSIYSSWKKANHREGETINVEILDKNHIVLK